MHAFLLVGSDCAANIKQILQNHQVAKPDVFSVEENPITIKTIRELKLWASRQPFQSPQKAAVIYNAHTLTLPAQHALLKTLEEPPPNTIIILTTPNQSLLLPTILSRCQTIHLPGVNSATWEEDIDPDTNVLLKILPSLSPAERILKAGEYSKTHDQAVSFIESLIAILRQQSNPHLRQAYQAHKHLKANVNPRLTLENFFLSW